MPSGLEKLATELKAMIIPDVLVITFNNEPPALITAYEGNSFQKELLVWYNRINGTLTAENNLKWKRKSLTETKNIEHFLIIYHHNRTSEMIANKMFMVNHIRTISIDISHAPEAHLHIVGYLAQYLLRTRHRPEKVSIRAHATTDLHTLKNHLDEGLGPQYGKDPKGVLGEHVIMPATPGQPISYQYLTWEAERLVWLAKPAAKK